MTSTNRNIDPEEIKAACQGQIHPMAVKGIGLFNQKEYWYAHEALEKAWLEEPGLLRNLYRGILQVGVVYLHVQRANYRGAVKVYYRSHRWLDPFPASCLGISLMDLRSDLEVVMAETYRLGPEALELFDQSLLKPINYTPPPEPMEIPDPGAIHNDPGL